MSRLARDGALVAEALAVVGLFVADVLGAVLGVADVAQPVGAGEVGAAGGLVEAGGRCRGSRISAQRRCSAGTASASRGSPSWASDAAIRPCTIGCALSMPHGQRGHALAEDEQQAGADAVDRLAEDGLATRADDSLKARTTRATRSSSGHGMRLR